ncbi:hypothetical protein [Actomonas aquatica]|uniref:FAD/FMN-containing dehydrogenase n=1 Tax=Actomonas aquatica TaxID=2866162 RepID=A0ABZ1C568_9BACT|nr:hypothetical protein [Opitutus sp. WL0086]WRQ86478.1 hypothetical protein K1X11_016805 [Opitutus sp. WL0086]
MITHVARNLLTLVFLPLFAAALGAADTPTDTYEVGDKFETIAVKDQHEKDVTVAPGGDTRHLIVSFVMGTGKDANRYFEKQGATWLEKHDAVFLANIYGMPGIGRMFALPKMKKYPHRILLGDDEHLLDRYPEQKGKLTVFDFNADGTIAAIRFLDPDDELDQLFAK